jgi:hypothetical protein
MYTLIKSFGSFLVTMWQLHIDFKEVAMKYVKFPDLLQIEMYFETSHVFSLTQTAEVTIRNCIPIYFSLPGMWCDHTSRMKGSLAAAVSEVKSLFFVCHRTDSRTPKVKLGFESRNRTFITLYFQDRKL